MRRVTATSCVRRVDRGTTAELQFCYRGVSPGLGATMAGQLRSHLNDIAAQRSEVNLVLLRGEAGGDFCPASDADASAVVAECVANLYTLTIPVIAAADKRCAEAGIALALASDMVIVTDRTVLAVQPADIDETTSAVLSQRAGRITAAGMALAGLPLTGAQAERAGIAQACVSSREFEAAIARLTATIGTASDQARAFNETVTSIQTRDDAH
jgi:enoyl-CoA hydratase/carnithine racemase